MEKGPLVSYPDPAEVVIPCSFRAGFYGYVLVCLLPLGMALLLGQDAYHAKASSPWSFRFFVLMLLIAAFGAMFLRSMKLEVLERGINYSTLFRGRFVAFSDISTAVLINFKLYPVCGLGRDPRRWTLVITPNPWTNHAVLKIPLTLFQPSACSELKRLLHTGDGCPPW